MMNSSCLGENGPDRGHIGWVAVRGGGGRGVLVACVVEGGRWYCGTGWQLQESECDHSGERKENIRVDEYLRELFLITDMQVTLFFVAVEPLLQILWDEIELFKLFFVGIAQCFFSITFYA